MDNKQLSKINKNPLFQINYLNGETEFIICSKTEFQTESSRLKKLGIKFKYKMFPAKGFKF